VGSGTSGSGLGLSIVRNIAQRHGAQVMLDSGPAGRGLSVCVVFPPHEGE
jgi:signal transduction histidine kinase